MPNVSFVQSAYVFYPCRTYVSLLIAASTHRGGCRRHGRALGSGALARDMCRSAPTGGTPQSKNGNEDNCSTTYPSSTVVHRPADRKTPASLERANETLSQLSALSLSCLLVPDGLQSRESRQGTTT
jgi:hypothetical protein